MDEVTDAEAAEKGVQQGLACREVIPALVVAEAGVILMWAAAVPFGPDVCRLTYPAPRNCFALDRVSNGIAWTVVLILVTTAVLLATSAARARRRAVLVSGLFTLAVVAGASFTAVAWIPALA